jgi:5-deoxy-glucuronate isomerase
MVTKKRELLVKPINNPIYQHVSQKQAGWNYLNFQARQMKKGETICSDTGTNENIFVLLGGDFSVYSSRGNWVTKNGRKNVFQGLPHALYLPPKTTYTLKAESDILDVAHGWCEATEQFEPRFITPEDVQNYGIEFRGGDNASRQINSILPPGSNCQRLVCVEVYTPSGNWSSFPAHKHDTRQLDAKTGDLKEACLEEVYFYKMEKPQGFAIQKVYTDDKSLNEVIEVSHNDLVLIPKGYHPVVAGHGYHVYYLNFLAGSDQSLKSTDDEKHKWIYNTWKGMDERLPLVTLEMNYK